MQFAKYEPQRFEEKKSTQGVQTDFSYDLKTRTGMPSSRWETIEGI